MLLCLWTLHTLAAAQVFNRTVTPWPLIPDPPRSQVQLVSEDMRANGVPMKIWLFKSAVSLEEVQAFFLPREVHKAPVTFKPFRAAFVDELQIKEIRSFARGPFTGPFIFIKNFIPLINNKGSERSKSLHARLRFLDFSIQILNDRFG